MLFTLFPIVALCIYNVPQGDDLFCGAKMMTSGLREALLDLNSNWNSRIVQNVLLLIFNPASFGRLKLFWLPPLILIIMVVVSLYLLLYVASRQRITSVERVSLLSVMVFFFMNYLPNIGETLFWISGSYTYLVPILAIINSCTVLYVMVYSSRIYMRVLSSIIFMALSFISVGTNEIAMAYVIGFDIVLFVIYLSKKSKLSIYFLLVLVLLATESYFVFSSPAFAAKGDATGLGGHNFLMVIVESIGRSLFFIPQWISAFFILFLFVYESAQKIVYHREFPSSKKWYIILCGCSIFSVICGFIPPLYATGWMPPRAVSIPFVIFIVLFLKLLPKIKFSFTKKRLYYALFCMVILVMSSGNNIEKAYTDLFAGKARDTYNQIMNDYSRMKTADKDDTIYVHALTNEPILMPIRWPSNKRDLSCSQMSSFFGVYVDVE